MNHIKTYRYKLKPTKAQEQQFEQWLGACRYVYNLCLEYKKLLWEQHRISIELNAMQKELTATIKGTSWLESLPALTRQDAVNRLFKAYGSFFKQGKGFPKFAQKRKYHSITFIGSVVIYQDLAELKLPLIGRVKYFNSRILTGEIKQAIVSKEIDGWYVSIVCRCEIQSLPTVTGTLGIDVGITTLAITSNGEKYENPRPILKNKHKLNKLRRSVARKKIGGKNREKAARKLNLFYKKATDTRRDYHHKLTTQLIRENQTITVEAINVAGLMKNKFLYKHLSETAWGEFYRLLRYKAKWYGRQYTEVSPVNTSKTCSNCGYIKKDLIAKTKKWQCPECKTTHDRDINAAINIENKAMGHIVTA